MLSLGLGPGWTRLRRCSPRGRSQSSLRLCPKRQWSPAAASASDSCCHPVTNCRNRRWGTWGQPEEWRREGPSSLFPAENPLRSSPTPHLPAQRLRGSQWLRKTYGQDITPPPGKPIPAVSRKAMWPAGYGDQGRQDDRP